MNEKKFNRTFRIIACILLGCLIVVLPMMIPFKSNYVNTYGEIAKLSGADVANEYKKTNEFSIPDAIYSVNGLLCVASIFVQCLYFGLKRIREDKVSKGEFSKHFSNHWKFYLFEFILLIIALIAFSLSNRYVIEFVCTIVIISFVGLFIWDKNRKNEKDFDIKKYIKQYLPCILLAFFMLWTSVGCMEATMEATSETNIKIAEKSDKEPSAQDVEIAGWTEGDRMSNAADRSWNGCNNLKDGYFSFMFYTTVLLNILMLGYDKESESIKKWIIRAFLISSMIVLFGSVVYFARPLLLFNVVHERRGMFNNSNHYGYYLCVVTIMSLTMFLKDKNIYFKGLSLITYILSMLIIGTNNTFGSYLGVLAAMLFLIVVCIIDLIKRKRIIQFIGFLLCFAYFLFITFSVAGVKINYNHKYYNKQKQLLVNTVSFLDLNLPDAESEEGYSTWRLVVEDQPSEEFDAWSKLEKPYDSNMVRNFKGLFKDVNILSGFVEETKTTENVASGEPTVKSGELASGNSMPVKKSNRDSDRNKSKATAETVSAENVSAEVVATETKAKVNEKSGLTDEVSNIGSGRGKVWLKSLDLMEQRPAFGWGLENMLNEFYQQYSVNEGRTHNLVLQLGGTTGIVGVLVYMIAVTIAFMKACFDYESKEITKKKKIIYSAIMLLTFLVVYFGIVNGLLGSTSIGKVFIGIVVATIVVALEVLVLMLIEKKRIKLRTYDWNLETFVAVPVFISYMVNSFFGNSAFYTSPYFMIFLGLLVNEAIHKVPFKEEITEEKK